MLAPLLVGGVSVVLILTIGIRVFWRLDGDWVLRHIARRCDVHDRPWPIAIRTLEHDLGLTSSPASAIVPNHCDPELIDCGRQWCRTRRGLD